MANKKINQLVSKAAILSTDIFGIGDATTGQLFKKTIAELQAAIGGAVISVNGLVGTVVLDTDDIQELATPTNKYFTDARARGAISLTVTGNSGASTYSSGTGVLNVPTYTLAGLGGITASFLSGTSGISYNSTTGVISYSGTVYTDASIRALLSGGTGISYNSSTGAISYSGTVYTDSSVRALISMTTTGNSGASTYNNTTGVINVPEYTLAGLGGISLTSLSGGTGITYNSSTGAISYSGTVYTDASVRALISASGAVSYNNTTGVISLTSGNLTEATSSVLTITGGTGAVIGGGTSIQVNQATTSVSGFLSSTDWTTFNNKQATISLTTTGTSGAATFSANTLNIPQYAAALSGTTNYVAKFTSSSAIGNSSIFDNGTNIGINTTSPNAQLHIVGNSISLLTSGIKLVRSEMAGQFIVMNYESGIANFTAVDSAFSAPAFRFNTSTNGTTFTERVRITHVGNVGIGRIPTTKFDVYSATGNTFSKLESGDNSRVQFTAVNSLNSANFGVESTAGATYTGTLANAALFGSNGNFATQLITNNAVRLTILSNGDMCIGMTASPYSRLSIKSNSTTKYAGFAVYAPANGNFIYMNQDNNVGWIGVDTDGTGTNATTNPLAFATSDVERMRIHINGNISINTSADNGYKLYVSGTIYATGNITANSDLTLKKNLTIIDNPTDKLMQLNGYAYQWKSDDSHQYGVIAQEVEKILPYAVSTGNDGIKGVSYNQIIPVLIEAVKEQKAKIENLEILLASK